MNRVFNRCSRKVAASTERGCHQPSFTPEEIA